MTIGQIVIAVIVISQTAGMILYMINIIRYQYKDVTLEIRALAEPLKYSSLF